MPATSKHQQRAMCMALAARKGDLKVGDLKGAALEIYKSDMTNKQIEDFTVLKEMRTLQAYLSESLLSNTKGGVKGEVESLVKELVENPVFVKNSKYKYDAETNSAYLYLATSVWDLEGRSTPLLEEYLPKLLGLCTVYLAANEPSQTTGKYFIRVHSYVVNEMDIDEFAARMHKVLTLKGLKFCDTEWNEVKDVELVFYDSSYLKGDRDYAFLKKYYPQTTSINISAPTDNKPATVSNLNIDTAYFDYGDALMSFKNCKISKLEIGRTHPNVGQKVVGFDNCSIEELRIDSYYYGIPGRLKWFIPDFSLGWNRTDVITEINNYMKEHTDEVADNLKKSGVKNIVLNTGRHKTGTEYTLTFRGNRYYFKK